jgi:hypothetical protein
VRFEKMNEIERELTELYRKKCNGMDVIIRLTPYEVEHLNTLTDIGMRERRRYLQSQARKEKRKLTDWERHLLAMDKKLWEKVREAEKLAFKEESEK